MSTVIYLLAFTVPIVIGLAIVGTTPSLLEKVPEEHRDTVAAFGDGAARLSGSEGGIFGFDEASAVDTRMPGAVRPHEGDWAPRRPGDHPPVAGLTEGLDYAIQYSEDGFIAHWPCGHEIPVRSFGAPPGSESDLAWAVEKLALASGLQLRYAGHGTSEEKEDDGAISVTYGDHPEFRNPEVAGVGGPTV